MERPDTLKFASAVFDIDFHPEGELLAVGLVTGGVHCYRYSAHEKQFATRIHKASCRAVKFDSQGRLHSAGKDGSWNIIDVERGKSVYRRAQAHADAINALCPLLRDSLAMGDEAGSVSIWDTRQRQPVRFFSENTDYIADMAFHDAKKTVVCAGGDGMVAVYDLRKDQPLALSDSQDDEFLSIALADSGKTVVTGTQDGALCLFPWGKFDRVGERLVCHPASVDALCAVSTRQVATGSSDSLLRVVTVGSGATPRVLGSHDDYPVERLALSRDNAWLASCSYSGTVKFWDLSFIKEVSGSDNDSDDDSDGADKTRGKPKSKVASRNGFFDGL